MRHCAKVAAEYGQTLGIEPLHRKIYEHWSMIGTIPEAIDLMDEIGEPNVKLLYDVYHLWDTDDVIEHTVKHGEPDLPERAHLRLPRSDPERLRSRSAR